MAAYSESTGGVSVLKYILKTLVCDRVALYYVTAAVVHSGICLCQKRSLFLPAAELRWDVLC